MKRYKKYAIIVFLNLFFSMLIVHISPRFDIITLFGFIFSNTVLFVILKINSDKERRTIQDKIEKIFDLLHSLDMDMENYEVVDDEFGKLRDEIIKIIVENKNIAVKATNNQQVLREYTEDIAHQVKTPLTGALLMLDLIEEDKENPKQYVDYMRKSINRLYQLSDILLKLAALDSGTVDMKKDVVNITGLIEDIKFDIETYFIKDDIDIPVYGDDFDLICDRRWTYEAVFNIVKNGIEASEGKGIEIHLEETNIFQSIIVKDFGKGLNNERLKKAYKRFYKEDPNSKGYGIGLPMAKSIMEKQNGELLYFREKTSNSFELRFYK